MIRIIIADPDFATRKALTLLLQRAYPHLKIVLLSVDANDEAAAKEAGADFVYKGASPDELIATLSLLLRKDT